MMTKLEELELEKLKLEVKLNKNIEKQKAFEKKIEELCEEIKKTMGWIPKNQEEYYYVSTDLEVSCKQNKQSQTDEKRIKYTKIFETEEKAQDYADFLKAVYEHKTEFTVEEWNDDKITKYYICHDYECDYDFEWGEKLIFINNVCDYRIGNATYFTRENAEAFIKKYEKQIKKYWFGVE